MLRNCHGHSLSKGNIIKIFYHGLNEITQEALNAIAGGIFLYKTPNQAFQVLKDKVLLKLDWAKNKKTKSHLKKTVAFTDEGSCNHDTDKIMSRIDAMTMKIDARYKEMKSCSNPISEYDEDNQPMTLEAEEKFRQTFHGTRFYNDYHDSNHDNWRSSGRNDYSQDNYRSNFDDKPYDVQRQLNDFVKSQQSTNAFVKEIFMEFKSQLESITKNHQASIQNLEAKFYRLADKKSARPSRSLPSNTQLNPQAFSCNALADLGASINLMPYSLYAKLSFKTLKHTQMSIGLTDRSFQHPIGISENMLVKVVKFTFPIDFVILEMVEDDLELKPLPDNLEYVFLEEPSFLPVIISSQLSKQNKNKLVYGKNCHLPFEIEHRAYWALKNYNSDLIAAGNIALDLEDYGVCSNISSLAATSYYALGNISVPITEPLVPEDPQSQNTFHASTSSYPVVHDRWSKDQHIELVNIISDLREGMLIRSMATKLIAASARWIDAMQEELNQFYRNKVWTLILLPYGKIAIGSKWVFKFKKDEHGIVTKNKPRLVAQGYSQEKGINYDETFTPVARIEAIRIFLAFATYMNFIVFQMDVKSAFLNRKLNEEVYVKQPPSFESSEFPYYVYKLDKALYGLKQEPKACMMEELTYFLRLQIKQDDKGISIYQEQYTRNLLKKYEISDSSLVKTPMVPPNNLGPDLTVQSKRITSNSYEKNPQCMTIAYDPNPPSDETQSCPLKEYLIKFSVMNGKMPFTLDFKTFTTSTGLDYNNGEYVTHPFPEVVKAELAKIVLVRNYSSTEQINSIQQMLASLPSMVSNEGVAKPTSFPKGPHGDKDSKRLKPSADMEPPTLSVIDLLGADANYKVDETQSS
ncbi:reverse transcriptase domain-containing protein [Tanacetum coccineum]